MTWNDLSRIDVKMSPQTSKAEDEYTKLYVSYKGIDTNQ